jgi:hypothetical protein
MGGVLVNFVAQFDIDDGTTDLVLESVDYDPSSDASVGAWCLLEPCVTQVGEAAA